MTNTPIAFNRRQLILGVTALALFARSSSQALAAEGDAVYASLLQGAVKPDSTGYNRVNYEALVARKADLDGVVAAYQTVSAKAMSANAAKAFWINLYNATTLKVIVDHYPVKSIKDIKLGGGGLFGSGPWSAKLVTVDGRALSLDDIEHKILRKTFKDPFIHYALNCASYSCPNLATIPYSAVNSAELMRESAKDYVNHPRGIDIKDGSITASKIYSWYAGDFGGKGKLKDHWKAQASPEKAALIEPAKISTFTYDWSLNNA
ncbi:MAG: DUF547 domain-containing protein [Rhizobiaceae bacterium]